MDSNAIDFLPRRAAIASGLRVVTSIALVSAVGIRETIASDKLAKSAVQYEDQGKSPGKDCDDCAQFIPGKSADVMGTCKLVEGAINPHGHCIAFTPKPQK
jgi:hypothetical protein